MITWFFNWGKRKLCLLSLKILLYSLKTLCTSTETIGAALKLIISAISIDRSSKFSPFSPLSRLFILTIIPYPLFLFKTSFNFLMAGWQFESSMPLTTSWTNSKLFFKLKFLLSNCVILTAMHSKLAQYIQQIFFKFFRI